MIKCAHLNMSQLYIRVSELSNISVLYFSQLYLQRETLFLDLVGADHAHTMTTVLKQARYENQNSTFGFQDLLQSIETLHLRRKYRKTETRYKTEGSFLTNLAGAWQGFDLIKGRNF